MASASSRHSYGGAPSESHHLDLHSVILNPAPPPSSNVSSVSRSSGGLGGFKGSSVATGKSDRKSGGGTSHRNNTRVSLPSASSLSTQPNLNSNYLHPQQFSHEDNNMVVNNITSAPSPQPQQSSQQQPLSNNNHHHQHPIINSSHPHPQLQSYPKNNTQLNHHSNSTATTSRKSTSARSSLNTSEIVNIDSDESEDRINTLRPPPKISGPSLAGPASGNRTLLQPYDPIERPNRTSVSPSIASLADPQPPLPLPSQQNRKAEKATVAKSDVAAKPTNSIPLNTNTNTEAKVPSLEQSNRNVKESTNSRSPKAKPTKSVSAPSPPGNGLLSGDMFNPNKGEEFHEVPTIIIHVPLNGETNKYINFAKLAEEKYGLYALNPRLAREQQLKKLAAVSGDEMMLDLSDSESAMEDKTMMSGVESTNENTKKQPTKKRKIMDAYDSHDPFIDDSEMLWEEQAATTKDGFFVYSGALVPEGEKVTIERADGTIKRGRGRGRATGATTRSTAAKPAAPRKPRITKKEKERLEREKEEQRLAALQQKA